MSCPFGLSRRGFIAGSGGALGVTTVAGRTAQAQATPALRSEPFRGAHQAGIGTPQQTHIYFAAFDVTAKTREEVVGMLRAWTDAAERMTQGETALPLRGGTAAVAPDGGTALGLDAARLTLTFGFGPGLFRKAGKDRYGIDRQRPEALAELPKFNGDQLDPARCGGDLSVQACADDPQVAFHAVRELLRVAYGAVELRWAQSGFLPDAPPGQTPRNLMGFKDGTNNPVPDTIRPDVPRTLDDVVWVRDAAPGWLRGGSYLVVRRIRISLEHWDRTELDFQQEVIGREKYSGAPLGKRAEFDPLELDRANSDGSPVIAETAHVRLAAAAGNDGALILRRGYSYNDGVRFTAERWPPWRQGMMYDAGLLFLAYQNDPRTGFIRLFKNMARFDMLNQYATHTASALFACPRGIGPGAYLGEELFTGAA